MYGCIAPGESGGEVRSIVGRSRSPIDFVRPCRSMAFWRRIRRSGARQADDVPASCQSGATDGRA
jgi:hypothetical protein